MDAAVDAITRDIKESGFSSAEEFINMDSFERAKRLKFFKDPNMDQAWKDLTDLERQRATKDATNKVVTLLMQDPVTHPMELLEAQMDSIFRADSQRQFLQGLRNMPVNSDTLGNIQYMVEIGKSETKTIRAIVKWGYDADHFNPSTISCISFSTGFQYCLVTSSAS